MNKKDLRQHIRVLKRTYEPSTLMKLSEQVCREVLSMEEWERAHYILLYYALADEVDTSVLLDEALRMHKQVLLPVVVGDDLVLRRYESRDSLKEGAFGILEPQGATFTEYNKIDLAIVPGMAFDADGHRLGRGKGYYDRLLPRLSSCRVGICFPFQLLPNVPSEAHDVLMDCVVTTPCNQG